MHVGTPEFLTSHCQVSFFFNQLAIALKVTTFSDAQRWSDKGKLVFRVVIAGEGR